MHYFSLHTENGSHIGFLIMTADDESGQPPQSGQFLVKLQSETPPPADIARLLEPFTDSGSACLLMQTEKDHVALYGGDGGDGGIEGRIRNEYLTLSGKTFLLNDLTGLI